jgi:hypothetical protein
MTDGAPNNVQSGMEVSQCFWLSFGSKFHQIADEQQKLTENSNESE